MKKIQVADPAGRLDKYLTREYPELSRSRLQALIVRGYVLVNGCGAKPGQRLNPGDTIQITLPPRQNDLPVAEDMPLDIVYEDADVIVVNKPAGLAVHPAPGHVSHTLVNALLAHYPGLHDVGDIIRPGIVHRLDKDTSGLMIVAKNSYAQQCLIDQFKSRLVSKAYLVLVKGKLMPQQGIIEAPVGRDPTHRKRMAVVTGGKDGRTRYKVREYLDDYTLLEVHTETGRTHQIRVHLSAIGYPVVGDKVYGVKSAYLKRQFVHAQQLGLKMPDGEYREFTCELPSDLRVALEFISKH
jgi:23S rRNA pseudouridine1911/1915/1917 synthase